MPLIIVFLCFLPGIASLGGFSQEVILLAAIPALISVIMIAHECNFLNILFGIFTICFICALDWMFITNNIIHYSCVGIEIILAIIIVFYLIPKRFGFFNGQN
ncbi:hypothetical protein FH968_23225 [Buttiauxella sp. B2]|uniref:hypothetical protein n=1 Tax=Buttiauxella sp. B2 TaxID=2587812 RepID=UPI001124C12D|nr:hypothetical protein [Buttiauxella sp. B2]TNV09590.1 hypothetical protein FH968_23225 [Buttiauxella sp. B2]